MKSSKTIIAIISVLAVALFIAACEEGGEGQSLKTFIGGTDSLSINFATDSPPAEVYDNKAYPFPVAVEVENKGEYDVLENVRISIDGIDPAEFGKASNDLTKLPEDELLATKLDPTTGNVLPGTKSFVEFGDFNYQTDIIGKQDKTLRATLCYDYATAAQAKLCVKDNPLDISGDSEICNVRGAKTLAVSSGPIQVSGFEQTPLSKTKIRFSFVVEQKGEATESVYKQTTDCKGRENENKVFLEVDTGDMSTGLQCSGLDGGSSSGYITLFDGKKTVICTQEIGGKTGQFEKVVSIGLKYGYEKKISTNVVVASAD